MDGTFERRNIATFPRTILLVEDDGEVRELLVEVVLSAGFRVIEAADAEAALKILQNSTDIDLIVSDVGLPGGMDGLQLIAQVRSEWPHIKSVVMSGRPMDDRRLDSFDAIFKKPFHFNELIDRMRQLLANAPTLSK